MSYRRTKPLLMWVAAIPILLLAASFWMRAQYTGLISMVDHSREVQTEIQGLLAAINDGEIGRRGFVATGDPGYLAMVQGAGPKSDAILARLVTLTRDDPVQQANIQVLDRLTKTRLRLLLETSRVAGQDEAVREERRTGLAASTDLARVMDSMMAEESRLLDVRKQATRAANFEADVFYILGTLSVIALLLWAYRIVRSYAQGRDKAEADVRQANQELQEKIRLLDRLNQELEDRVRERTAGLERSNQDLQQFAFVASHDLQEPLRMVASYLGLLEKSFRGKLDSDTEKYMAFALDGATRMQALIRDLLSYAQVSAQAPVLTRAKLKEVLGQARYGLLESIRETGAEITAGPLPEVEVDSLKMSLVFQNLLSNAIKFKQPSGHPSIHIEAQKEADNWRISVRDRGIGFEPKYAEKIFVAFQRLHGKGKYPGTGIGLAICKRIIEGHGGRIWAESGPDGGATFHFTLPAQTDASSFPGDQEAVPAGTDPESRASATTG